MSSDLWYVVELVFLFLPTCPWGERLDEACIPACATVRLRKHVLEAIH